MEKEEVVKNLSERIFHLFQTDFGEFSKMSPSFHRAISHSEEFAQYYQKEGFTIGEMSETAQEAINCPTKKDVAFFSFRGSQSQNLQCFQRNWTFADPFTLEFAEWNKNSFPLTHVDVLLDHMMYKIWPKKSCYVAFVIDISHLPAVPCSLIMWNVNLGLRNL